MTRGFTSGSERASPRVRAFIGLGSNLDPREEHLHAALAGLRRLGDVTAVSTFHQTAAVPESGVAATDPEFLNAVAALETRLAPRKLLGSLLEIEAALGRDRSDQRRGPRAIDLDLLLFENTQLAEPGLVVPHPRMHLRRFVLAPLAQIAPGAWHPGCHRTAAELLKELAGDDPPRNPEADRRQPLTSSAEQV